MKPALLIAGKDLRLRLRDRSAIIQAFVAPLVLASIISFAFGGSAGGPQFRTNWGVSDGDQGTISKAFVQGLQGPQLKKVVKVNVFKDPGALRAAMRKGWISAGFIVPIGFSDAIAGGASSSVRLVTNPTRSISGTIANAVAKTFTDQINASRLSIATSVVLGAPRSPQEFQQRIADVTKLRIPASLIDGRIAHKDLKPASYFGPSMSLFFLFFTVQMGARSMLTEKNEGTLARLVVSPIKPRTIIIGKVVASFVLGLLSLAVMYAATTLLFGADWGDPLSVAALCTSMVFAAMALTAMVITLAKSDQQAEGLSSIVIMALTLLGGNFIPISQAPLLIRKLSLLTPNGWALKAFSDLSADGGGIRTIVPALLAILAFGTVAGSIALVRARRLVVR
ncbi:MAG: ABC transporter permease [Actinomycetota bacterium]|nr:ABC transporter permease [Actinomycetota bacterium]